MFRRSLLAVPAIIGLTVGAKFYWPRRWRYIAIHHSGGNYGDMDLLRQVHRQRQPKDPVDEIPYHFVVGNGRGMGLGEVAATGRWDKKMWGAHLSSRNSERNFRGIGICLVGNFETTEVPEAQFQAAVELARDLARRYHIRAANLTAHGSTPGERTLCPGRNFPMKRFRERVYEGWS